MTQQLSYRFTANDPDIRTHIGVRDDNVIHVSGGKRGVALYGPYVSLPPGRYEATVKFSNARPCAGKAVMEVRSGHLIFGRLRAHITKTKFFILDNHPIFKIKTFSKHEKLCFSLKFTTCTPVNNVEVLLISGNSFRGAIESIEIFGEAAVPLPTVEVSDLPIVQVENLMHRNRNLHDGYQRGTGLQFYNLTSKIRFDPDFIEARQMASGRTIVSDNNLCNIFLIFKLFLPHLPAGHIVEFGTYRGGSAIFMAALARKFLPGARVFGFDTFCGMPPTDERIDHHKAGAFNDVDLIELHRYVAELGLQNIEFVQGDFNDTAALKLPQIGKVSFCHVDCDIRSAIECAYNAARPYMISGGYWVFDDLLVSDCLGAVEAVEDLLIRRDGLNSEQVFPHYVFRQP